MTDAYRLAHARVRCASESLAIRERDDSAKDADYARWRDSHIALDVARVAPGLPFDPDIIEIHHDSPTHIN